MSVEPEAHFRGLESMYAGAPINRTIPCRLKVRHQSAEVRMEVGREYWHAAGAMHGSLYFKALDDAAFFAANSIVLDTLVLTARFEVKLLAPISSTAMCAVGQLDRHNGRKLEASSTLYVEEQIVAKGCGLFIVSSHTLADLPDYRRGAERATPRSSDPQQMGTAP